MINYFLYDNVMRFIMFLNIYLFVWYFQYLKIKHII